MPAQETERRKLAVAAVFDRAAATYDRVGVSFFTAIAGELVSRVGPHAGDRVLDLGCGRGAVTFAAAAAVGPSGAVTGLDLAPQMVELTRTEAATRGVANVRVQVGDAERPAFSAGSFDVLLASLVLFFLPDPRQALMRYAELLTADGRLGFTTFAREDEHVGAAMRAIGAYLPGGPPDRDARQGPFATSASIGELLGSAGWTVRSSTEVSIESRFDDLDQWTAWLWSHGGRATLEQVAAADLPSALEAARTAFDPARTPDGDLLAHTLVRVTVAEPSAVLVRVER